jgi:hypothetical protein
LWTDGFGNLVTNLEAARAPHADPQPRHRRDRDHLCRRSTNEPFVYVGSMKHRESL